VEVQREKGAARRLGGDEAPESLAHVGGVIEGQACAAVDAAAIEQRFAGEPARRRRRACGTPRP
jgi:hypothetical protein